VHRATLEVGFGAGQFSSRDLPDEPILQREVYERCAAPRGDSAASAVSRNILLVLADAAEARPFSARCPTHATVLSRRMGQSMAAAIDDWATTGRKIAAIVVAFPPIAGNRDLRYPVPCSGRTFRFLV